MQAEIQPFFDPDTFTYSYVLKDPASKSCAVIDPVLDYNPVSGLISTNSVEKIIAWIRENDLELSWILETHVHADHLSAAQNLKQAFGGKVALGAQIGLVQSAFAKVFNAEATFQTDGSQFDHLFSDGDKFNIGELEIQAMHTPGHTPACMSYVLEGAAFVGDTLFMPDYGTARTDFPGGDAGALYQSIQKLFALPAETVLYMCHDYGSSTRSTFCCETTVQKEQDCNIHIHSGVGESEFVQLRESRDADLAAPKLLYPSVQFNMRAGNLAQVEDNGTHYFKIPVRTQ